MRFFKNIFNVVKRNKYIVTEKEIDEQLEKYYNYKNQNPENSTIKLTKNYKTNYIISQVSNQVSAQLYMSNENVVVNEYNEYESEEELWTRLQAS